MSLNSHKVLGSTARSSYGFGWYLAGEDDDGSWQAWSDGNTFAQFDRHHLVTRAQEYIAAEGLGPEEACEVMDWAEGLPWRDGMVTLHMAW